VPPGVRRRAAVSRPPQRAVSGAEERSAEKRHRGRGNPLAGDSAPEEPQRGSASVVASRRYRAVTQARKPSRTRSPAAARSEGLKPRQKPASGRSWGPAGAPAPLRNETHLRGRNGNSNNGKAGQKGTARLRGNRDTGAAKTGSPERGQDEHFRIPSASCERGTVAPLK